MSARALRLFAIMLIMVAVVLGGLAYMMNRGANRAETVAAQEPGQTDSDRVEAVVATAPLLPYKAIKAEDVSLVPISVVPKHYFKSVDEVVGRKPVSSVDQGAPLSPTTFSEPSALSKAIPPGTEAMSLSVSDVVAVGGFVKPGDFVDVLIYIRASGSEVDDTQARILLRNVRLLAYDQQLINGEASQDSDSRSQDRTAVVAVPEPLMTRVMLGASIGELRLALRRSVESAQKSAIVAMDDAQSDAAPSKAALMPPADQFASSADGEAGAAMSEAERQEVDGVEQVITLKELAALKAKKQNLDTSRPEVPARVRRRPVPTVEIYEGVDSHRVSRPQ